MSALKNLHVTHKTKLYRLIPLNFNITYFYRVVSVEYRYWIKELL